MRTPSAREQALLRIRDYATRLRVFVADELGNLRNVSTLNGEDFLEGAQISESVDEQIATCSISLLREIFRFSLSPMIETSAPNNLTGSYSPLVFLGRLVVVEAQLAPAGGKDVGEWREIFRGTIDRADPAGETIAIECSDQLARYRDHFIGFDRVYGTSLQTDSRIPNGVRVFANGTAYNLDELVQPTVSNGKIYRVTTAGTTAAIANGAAIVEPAWGAAIGSTCSSGTVVFTAQAFEQSSVAIETVIQQILNDAAREGGFAAATVSVPASPGFQITPYIVERGETLEAIEKLTGLIGWVLRFRWDAALGFALTLYEPNRAGAAAAHTFSADQIVDVTRAELDRSYLRNVVRLWWHDAADLTSGGLPRRKLVELKDAASIAKFGQERAIEISERETSPIDTLAEANALATAILSDLSDPKLDGEIVVDFFPFAQLDDVFTFGANATHFSSAQSLAVVSIVHSFSNGEGSTSLGVRGKPSGGFQRWIDRAATAKAGPKKTGGAADWLPSVTSFDLYGKFPGLALVKADLKTAHAGKVVGAEFYARDAAGTTEGFYEPTSADLVTRTRGDQALIAGKPGDQISVRVVPVSESEGEELAAIHPGALQITIPRLSSLHFNPGHAELGKILNGTFASSFPDAATTPEDDPSVIPDHWSIFFGQGTFGTNVTIDTSIHEAGARSVKFGGAVQGKLQSAPFPVTELHTVSVVARFRSSSINSLHKLHLAVEFFNAAGTSLGTSSGNRAATVANAWQTARHGAAAPSGARYAVAVVGKVEAAAYDLWVQSVRTEQSFDRWHEVNTAGEPGFQNGWLNYSTGFNAAAFRLRDTREAEIRGLIKSGTVGVGVAVFTMPTFYAPLREQVRIIKVASGFADLRIKTNGVVNVESLGGGGTNAFVSLDGVSWSLD